MKPFDLETLNDEQLAGQRLMVGFDGTEFNEDLAFLIGKLKVGGIILFSRNVESPEQVRRLCRDCQDCARAGGQPPLIIAVDQEGGPVARLRAPFTEFAGNAKMTGEEDALEFARVTAAELCRVGINMNLAPVMDLAPIDIDSVMADRSFGPDPQWVSQLGSTVIDGLQAGGIMAVAKHFPGIGRTTLDSHLDLPVCEADRRTLEEADLVPFRAAAAHEAAGVMLSHVRYPAFDPQWPASLSSIIADSLLRGELGYTGLTLTDDLDMGAIKKHTEIPTALSRILSAGIDLILICHRSPDMETAFEHILSALRGSEAERRRCVESAARILAAKKGYIG